MPNDPRLKFKKKVYDASRNIIYFQGSGGGGRLRSIYEDGTPTDEGGGDTGGGGTGGGGTGGGGVVPYTPRDIPAIPQPIKPTLDPGAISGITIGSVAAAAALTEAARRTLNAQRQRQQGFTEISQKDLSSRQSGSSRRTTSKRAAARGASGAISRTIETAGQAFEMMTPTRAAGYSQVPIQAEMVPPSGAVTPVADLQRATTRPSSGASTPSPAPVIEDINALRKAQVRAIEEKLKLQITNASQDIGPDRLSSIFPTEEGRFGTELRLPAKETPAIPQRPNEPINLEEKLISLKSELVNPSISEARSKTIQSEIRVLEKQITASGGRRTLSLEERIRLAMNTPLQPQVKRTPLQPQETASGAAPRPYSESLIQLTPEERARLERTALFDLNDPYQVREMTDTQFREFVKNEGINIGGPSSGAGTPETPQIERLQSQIDNIELKLMDPQMPRARRQQLIAEQTEIRNQIAIEQTKLDTFHRASIQRASEKLKTSKAAEIRGRRISKTLTPETAPRELEMQRMGTRNPIPSNQAALERARTAKGTPLQPQETASGAAPTLDELRIIGPELPESAAAGVGFDLGEPGGAAYRERMRQFIEEPTAPPERPAPAPAPVERVAVATETSVDRFNKIYDRMVEGHRAAGFEIPTAPEGMTGIERQKHIMDEIIRETDRAGNKITEAIDTPKERILTPEEAFAKIETEYTKALNDPNTRRPVEAIAPEEHIGTAVPKGKKGKLTKKTGLLATEEQRLRPTALAGEAQARVQSRTGAPAEVRATAPEARVAAPEARIAASAPEAMSARSALAPELSARTPTLAPPEPVARGRVLSQVQSINTTGKPLPPTETPTPSAPPSAPGTETATPREGIIREQTPAERAAFAEEVSLGLKGKKVPGRQKAKINSGKTNKATLNPLEKFVGPQFRNTPNLEIHPSAKNLRGALAELGSRVPKLVPSKKVLMSAGANFVAEAGGMVTGFFAGSEAGKAMNKYFATHPPTNRTDEYGQALATSMVALGVGNLVSKAVTYAIKQGARIAMGAELTGSISGAGIAGASAVFEAGVFATVATTTQFFITKALEDAGNSHAYSRTMGSIYATEALMYTEVAMWLGKGGPVNLAGDVSFLASELFIIGFGIWSAFEEFTEGKKEDENEAALREEERLERARAEQERRDTVAAINRTNAAKAAFLQRLPLWDYDFDALYARLTDKEKQELGITSPETKLAFQKDVERAFDPFGAFQKSDNGLVQDPPVQTQVEKDRSEVMNSYINWYIDELRGVRHEPFNFDDPKVRELNEYSGGTWKSAAQVSASTNHLQAERVHPLIERAQNEIIDAFHNERKTIEQMDELTVRYATLDPTFRANYEAYIITDAAAQILVEFNNTQSTYNEVDPALLAIADRDPNFRAAADAYYQVLANQARDYQLTISEVAHLNSLMENEQEIELGKLNEARNRIIDKNQAENQAMVDAYNANILREINIYGDNFEAIIRNINEQSLLSGHTFLYASNRADLYRQLHLEVPEIEFVDPVDEIDGKRPDATWHQGKGRKAGDTAIYHYRYNLTDEQNQEIEDLIASNQISRFDAEKQALIIYNRDRAKFVQTDEEKAADLGLSLDAYYKKFGIVDPTVISTEPTYKDLQILYPEQYRNLRQKYANDPDADSKIEETLARAHKRRMEESGGIYTPLEQAPDLKVEQLQQMYPDFYESIAKNVRNKDGSLSPESVKFLEISLRMHHELAVEAGTAPPVPVETRDPTYEELQLMYPEQFDIYNDANTAIGQEDKTEAMLRRLHRRRTEAGTAPPLPEPTIVIDPTLKNGIVNMPDGSTRTYRNGLVVNVLYRNADEMKLTDFKNAQEINAAEGVQKSDYTPTKTAATTLRQGVLTMPDGSKRFYVDGKVVSVDYPEGVQGKTIKEINDAEGINSVPIANQAVDPGGLPTQIQTPTELTYEQLQVMYPDKYQMYNRSYANSAKYGITPPSPEEQATMIEGLLRTEHANRTQAGTAQPLPTPTTTTTTTPTTNQPLPMVPGARSFEYADSGTQAAPATNP